MGELKKIWRIAAYEPKRYVLLIVFGSVLALMGVSLGLIYGQLINLVAGGKDFSDIMLYGGLSVGYVVLYSLMNWYQNYLLDCYYNKGLRKMRGEYVERLFNAPVGKIVSEDSARYINNINNDVPSLLGTYFFNFYYAVINCVRVAASFIAILVLNWRILLMMLGFTVVMAILPFIIKKKLDAAILEVSQKTKEYLACLKDRLLGIPIIKNFGAEEQCAREIDDSAQKLLKFSYKRDKIDAAAGGLGMMVRELAVVCLILLTCYLVYAGMVEVGAVLTVFSVGSQFFSGILGVSAVITYVFSSKGLRENLEEILECEQVLKERDLSFENRLEIKNLVFSYGDGRNVLDGVSLEFKPRGKYLVLGKSGSGKSTLLKILSGQCRDYGGEIFLDGEPYSKLSEKDLCAIVSLSQQKCYLFNRSFRENIDFLKDCDERKLARVIELCGLSPFVEKLPEGLETVVDEEVNQVSGGEKMRINLARAVYRDSKILLLDEVTGALDKATSEIVENNLLSIGDKTIINVCHKFNDSTLARYDGIIIVEEGKIAVSGDFQTLKDTPLLAKYRNVGDKEEAI